MLKDRWQNFTHPYGPRRMFSPRRWQGRGRILVFGELLAVIAAIAAVLVEWADWGNGTWLVIVATITGTLALLWYAFMQVSEGEPPLTAPLAGRMRLVAHATEMELQGIVFDWDGIDRQGRIPMDMTNWSKLTPEGQETYRRNGMDKALLSPEMVASSELARQHAVLQVLEIVESPDSPLPRTVLRIVEGRSGPRSAAHLEAS